MKKLIIMTCVSLCGSLFGAIVSVPPGVDLLQGAIAGAIPGDTIQLEAGIHTMTSGGGTALVDKNLIIQGNPIDPPLSATVTTSDDALNVMMTVASSNVTFTNFIIEHLAQTSSSDTAFGMSGNNYSNVLYDNLQITYTETGITSSESSLSITNNFFDSASAVTNDHRCIILSGNLGTSIITDNTFNSKTVDPNGTIFSLLTSNGGDAYSGSLAMERNELLAGEDPIKQFFVMESFAGAPGSFAFSTDGNVFENVRGSFIFFSLVDTPANLFSSMSMNNNVDSSNPPSDYKGLVAFDGIVIPPPPPLYDIATDPNSIFSFSGNVLTVNAITEPGWAAAAPGGLLGYDTAVYNPFFLVPSITTLSGNQYTERFLTQGDLVNALSWESPDPAIDSFNIYKTVDTNLIANVPAVDGQNVYLDHNQKVGVTTTYFVSAVSGGSEGTKVSVTIP